VAAAAGLAGCGACEDRREERRPPARVARSAGGWRELTWSEAEVPPDGQAALVRPGDADAPLLVALHGRGEAGRGLATGARGWRDDYDVERVEERLRAGAIEARDLGGFARDNRLAAMRASLAAAPYRGLTLVTPYTPALRDRSPEGAAGFVRFVDELLVPAASSIAGRGADAPLRCGIDGVSMGGRLALWAAILRPARFASVGAMQPAIAAQEADAIAEQLAAARARASFSLRLVSSDDDPFLEAVRALAERLGARSVPHTVIVTPGPHDYAWNRGPGAAELLLHHERVLRGLPPP
jgi:hypothetical protein